MNYGFIYPCDPFDSKKVEETFEDEFKEVSSRFPTFLINVDDLENKKQFKPIKESDLSFIYRGWMLTPENYEKLEDNCNYCLVTTKENYLKAHHLPLWYNELSDLTPTSIVTTVEDAAKTFEDTGWDKAFIKDYVKSLKTGKGSIVDSREDIERALKDMVHYRGFIEGGIVLREVHTFLPETEKRFFVANGLVYSPTGELLDEEKVIIDKVTDRKHNLFLYSIDLIKDRNDKLWLVEIGDGQVSDCVGWDIKNFAKVFEVFLPIVENKMKM